MGDVIIKPVMSVAERERTDSLAAAFADIKKDEEITAYRMENARLRQVISCATCPICSEEIADRKWDIDEKERLVHVDCKDEPE